MNSELLETTTQTLSSSPLWAWIALGGGLLFAAFASIGAFMTARRARLVETLVGQRTDELAQINEKLAEEICDHLNTEHALDKERESLKAVLNNLHEGILVLDSDGQVRIANGAALHIYRQVFGSEAARLEQLNPADFFASPASARRSDGNELPHRRALHGDTVRDHELIVEPPERNSAVLSISAQPLFTSDGRQHGAIVVVRDITDIKKIERLKAEFVATVSHELRTPITSIRGSLGLIVGGASGPLTDKTKHLVEIALRNSERLGHLINDLLDIEKIESGKMRFELAQHSLGELVRQAVEANCAYAENFHVRFALEPPERDIAVLVDPYRLLQVLANLLSNAAKFAPQDSDVDIAILAIDEHVRVSVRDRGPGIPPEFHSRIFQKFSQADSSDARSRSGTGLGLAICKAIVEQMNGRISFDTEQGAGTTFYFELPVCGTAEPVSGRAGDRESGRATEASR